MTLKDRIVNAGKALTQGGLNHAVKTFTSNSFDPAEYRQPEDIFDPNLSNFQDNGGNWWTMFANAGGSGKNYFDYIDSMSAWRAFWLCPPLNAIIMRKTRAYSNGRSYLVDAKGEEITPNKMSKYGNLAERLRRPNALQNWKQFDAQVYAYTQIFGFALVLNIHPIGWPGLNQSSSLWVLPMQYLTINYKRNFNLLNTTNIQDAIEYIRYDFNGYSSLIDLRDVYIFKDYTMADCSIFPESNVKSCSMPINNIIGAYESRNKLINYRGAFGILSRDPGANNTYVPHNLDIGDKKELQQDFLKYGIRRDQYNVIITNAMLKWQSMTIATKDLMLFEEVEADTQALCDAWGYQHRLLGSNSANSLGGSDADKYNAMVYQNAIIPESVSLYEQYTEVAAFTNGEQLVKDFRDVWALQEDDLQNANARKARNEAMQIEWENDQCTRDEWREANNENPIGDATGDMYRSEYMKSLNVNENATQTDPNSQPQPSDGNAQGQT